jgi:endonuclease G
MCAHRRYHSKGPGGCGCGKAAQDDEFDPKVAFDRLAKKQEELAQLFAEYMGKNPVPSAARAFALDANPPKNMAEAVQRIVGGFPVAVGDFPECALIGRRNQNGTFAWFCTGVLVHPRIVLTAGHCFEPGTPANVMALKAEDQTRLDDAEIISVQRMVQHPDYPTTRLHDISVIVLRSASKVAPVRLATAQELGQAINTHLVGFGNDDVLSTRGFGVKREVTVPITASLSVGNSADTEREFGFESDLEFVAGGGGFDSCNGDSGGPAYIDVAGERVVAGVTSRATDNARSPCGGGGIYTRVDVHLDFIKQVAKGARITI